MFLSNIVKYFDQNTCHDLIPAWGLNQYVGMACTSFLDKGNNYIEFDVTIAILGAKVDWDFHPDLVKNPDGTDV